MFSCMATLQPMLNTSMPAPARNAKNISGSTCGSRPRISSGAAKSAMPSMPDSSGRAIRTRSMTRVISSSPTDSAERM